jgi:hypothetical protein
MKVPAFTVEIRRGIIVLIDQKIGPTITNGAEQVVEELGRRGFDFSMPIFYVDTTGRWDGLIVEGGKFKDFLMIGAWDYDEARAKLRDIHKVGDAKLGDARLFWPG